MIKIHLLGLFQLNIQNKDCTSFLLYDKVKLLLAILCLNPDRFISRAQLADMLWPEATADKGRARLRHALHSLRQAFSSAPHCLTITQNTGVSLSSEQLDVDVLALLNQAQPFTDPCLQTASQYYSGTFLNDLKLPQGEAFLTWYQGWQQRCQLELNHYRSGLFQQCLALENLDLATQLAKEWVQQQPAEETHHRLLIRAFMQKGDKESALQAYKYCCTALLEHVGSAPSHDTFSLLEQAALINQAPVITAHDATKTSFRPVATVAIAISWLPLTTYDNDANTINENTAEDALDLIQQWKNTVHQISNQHGGWLSQVEDSTILIHYGYPQFSERPIVQAIDLAQALTELTPPRDINLGIALHADSTLIAESSSLNINSLFYQSVVPLAWKAQSGQVLLSASAAARMSSWHIDTLSSHQPKRYALVPNNVEQNLQRMHGRLQEFDFLHHCWNKPLTAKPVFINIHGLPGLGKSQLAHTLAMLVRNTGGQVIYLQGSPILTAFYTWLTQCLAKPESFSLSKDQLQNAWQHSHTLHQQLAINHLPAIEQALKLIEHYQSNQPLLIILDDLTGADPTALAFLNALKQAKPTLIKLILGLSRTPLVAIEADQKLELKPLDLVALNDYLTQRTRHLKISAHQRHQIVELSAGNPQYLEELIHLYQLGLPIDHIPRVADLILNQLTELNETARCVAYLVASLDQSPISVIQEILGLASKETHEHLSLLCQLGLIQKDKNHCFSCQSITKTAIQKSMTRQDKQQLYTQIAHYFIHQQQPAHRIAKQLQQARSPEAAEWWRQAILEAQQQGASHQISEHITEAILSYQYMENIRLRKQYELESYMALGSLQVSQYGPVSIKTQAAYEKAAEVHADLDNEDQLPVVWGNWIVTHSNGQLVEAFQLAKKLQKMALAYKQTTWYGWSLYAEAQYFFWKGNPVLAERLLLEAINALLQRVTQPPAHSPLSHHSDALAFSALALAQAAQGRHENALENANQAIQRAKKSQSAVSLIICHIQLLRVYYLADQLPTLYAHSQSLLQQLQIEAPQSIWSTIVTAYCQLCQLILDPKNATDIQELNNLIPVIEQNLPLGKEAFLCVVARGFIALNNINAASDLLDKALMLSEQRNSCLLQPEIYCLRGDIWHKQERADLAKKEWQKAKKIIEQNQLDGYGNWITQREQALWVKTENLPLQTLAT